jgi:NAD+ synthase
MSNLSDRISKWIADKVTETGCKGVVFGLSGGLDSAVVAALCLKSIAKDNVLGVFLPCYSDTEDAEDAMIVERHLGLKTEVVGLEDIFDNFAKSVDDGVLGVSGVKMSRANLKARIRMSVLYYIANSLNYLVVGTGNKSEIMIGYSTKYGDGGCDILPIGDLYKGEVRSLAKELGIPEKIITKAPSAGLWRGQTDEGEFGMSYEQLDAALVYLETEKRYAEIDDTEAPAIPKLLTAELINKVRKMVVNSQHKRSPIPIFTCYKGCRKDDPVL